MGGVGRGAKMEVAGARGVCGFGVGFGGGILRHRPGLPDLLQRRRRRAKRGVKRLGDSNLDWGQDLPALSDWYKSFRADSKNEIVPFYLSYFGMTDPEYYGISYKNVYGGYPLGPPAVAATPP